VELAGHGGVDGMDQSSRLCAGSWSCASSLRNSRTSHARSVILSPGGWRSPPSMSVTVQDGEAVASSQLQLCRTCSRVAALVSVLVETVTESSVVHPPTACGTNQRTRSAARS
jgi:hypothetical protein